jgi:hypothetical protein
MIVFLSLSAIDWSHMPETCGILIHVVLFHIRDQFVVIVIGAIPLSTLGLQPSC